MTSIGSDIVDLLKQREGELHRELNRVRTALKALGAPVSEDSGSASGPPGNQNAQRSTPSTSKKGKAGRPPGSTNKQNTGKAGNGSTGGAPTVLERIENVLRSATRPLTPKELLRRTGAPASTISTMLQRGREAGRLLNPAFGVWTVPGVGAGQQSAGQANQKGNKKQAKKKAATKKAASPSAGKKKTGKKRGRPPGKKNATSPASATAANATPAPSNTTT